MEKLNRVQLSDCIIHNKLVETAIATAIIVYLILIIVRYFRSIPNDNSEESAQHENNDAEDDDRINNGVLISLQAISILVIYLASIISKNVLLVIFCGLPTLLRGVVNFFSGLNSSYEYVSKKENHLTVKGKASIIIVALYLFSVPFITEGYIGETGISKDFVVLLLVFVFSAALCFPTISVIGLLIGEIADYFCNVSIWEKIYQFGLNCKYLRELNALPIWKKARLRLSNLPVLARVPLYFLTYILCLAINIVLAILFMAQCIIQLTIVVGSYLIRFVEFIIKKINLISDSAFIWVSIRISFIFSLILTEVKIVNSKMVSSRSQTIFEYISEALLIPLILTEALNVRTHFQERNT